MIDHIKPLLSKFTIFAKNRMGFTRPPRLFLKQDLNNSKCMLGKTAHYDPQQEIITIFITGRHPKDILRSYAHELVHHTQNCKGDLSMNKMKTLNHNYAQENPHMRKMEEEAYLQGNMCFRDWEDGLDNKLRYKIHIAEQIFLKENKKMSVKLNKKDLKGLISKLLEKRLTRSEDIQEAGCSKPGKKMEKYAPGKKSEEEVVEEAADDTEEGNESNTDSKVELKPGVNRKKADRNGDDKIDDWEGAVANAAFGDKKKKKPEPKAVGELKIRTPEQEVSLYEQRFTPKNNRLFESLVKKWTK